MWLNNISILASCFPRPVSGLACTSNLFPPCLPGSGQAASHPLSSACLWISTGHRSCLPPRPFAFPSLLGHGTPSPWIPLLAASVALLAPPHPTLTCLLTWQHWASRLALAFPDPAMFPGPLQPLKSLPCSLYPRCDSHMCV